MGYLNVHLQKVIEKKDVSKTTIGRGDFIELFYRSDTSSTNRYALIVLNIWPRRGAMDKKLLHAINLDDTHPQKINDIVNRSGGIVNSKTKDFKYLKILFEGKSKTVYNKIKPSFQMQSETWYKTFKMSKVFRINLLNYDFGKLKPATIETTDSQSVLDEEERRIRKLEIIR